MDRIEALVAEIIDNQKGSLARIVSPKTIAVLARGDIFAVIFHSISQSLTLRLHELLKSHEHYHGVVEVLPHLLSHRQIFGFCGPSMKLEKRILFVLSGEISDQPGDSSGEASLVDEVVEWLKDNYPLIGLDIHTKGVEFNTV